jgi:hypothetical protein
MRQSIALPLVLLAAACSQEQSNTTVAANVTESSTNMAAAPANEAAVANVTAADNSASDVVAPPATQTAYLGRWIGPEGLVLEVTANPAGGVDIVNQWSLDDKGKFQGSVTAEGLRWMRGNEPVSAVLTSGDATGMKWLAGKKTCLTVTTSSEAYCRD